MLLEGKYTVEQIADALNENPKWKNRVLPATRVRRVINHIEHLGPDGDSLGKAKGTIPHSLNLEKYDNGKWRFVRDPK